MLNNTQRYARDNFLLATALATKKSITFLCVRRSPSGERMLPARLLYTKDLKKLPEQADALFLNPPRQRDFGIALLERTDPGIAEPPRPRKDIPPIAQLPITAFRDYFVCPYRFYLKQREQVRGREFDLHELDGKDFGNLLHKILDGFAKHTDKNTTDWKRIDEICQGLFEKEISFQFDLIRAEPALRLQIEQLRLRLKAFAKVQAERSREGWQIYDSEVEIQPALFRVDTSLGSVGISGRIDRIDIHAERNVFSVLDYKSADKAQTPENTHRKRKQEWKDLQLPLYRFAVLEQFQKEVSELGYINLSQNEHEVGVAKADWKDVDFSSAYSTAQTIIEKILRAEFWPPNAIADYKDDYAVICRSKSFSAEDL